MDPILPLPAADFPVVVQVVNNETAACWEGSFDAQDVTETTAEQLKARRH